MPKTDYHQGHMEIGKTPPAQVFDFLDQDRWSSCTAFCRKDTVVLQPNDTINSSDTILTVETKFCWLENFSTFEILNFSRIG